jgi:hypothetical protein
MKLKSPLISFLIFSAATACVAYFLFKTSDRSAFSEKQVMLVMRGIGHQVLLKAGDFTSRVLPVKRINPTVFELEFQSTFKFVPDTLVRLVHASLASGDLPLQYMVNVMECASNQIIYGYRIGSKRTTLVPCLGREQAKRCYTIQIAFLENPTPANQAAVILGFALTSIALFAFVVFRKGNRSRKKENHIEGPFIPLGSYSFYANRRLLKNGTSTIALTDKESKLLTVLAANQNQPMERDQLLKEVWEDDGVFVGRSLDVFISKLRKKLLQDEAIRIVNIHGKGYKLEVD